MTCRSLLRRTAVLAGSLALALVPAMSFAWEGVSYRPGEGLSLAGGRVNVGGYLSVEATALDQSKDQLKLEDLSTFLTLHLAEHWLLFSEMEVEDPVHVDDGGVGSGDDVFSLERLYLQWEASDSLRLRVGKMLTPFGIWNQVHAAPLVWTTSRPLATQDFFDTGVTGIELSGSRSVGRLDLAATLWGQPTGQLDDTNDLQQTRRGFGGRFELTAPHELQAGVSFVRFRDHTDHRDETSFGADLMWSARYLELSAEIAADAPDSGSTTWAAYLQLVAHAPWHLHPFVRVEYADLVGYRRVPFVFGFAYKPTAATILKFEGLVGGDDTDLGGEGFLTSFAMLF